MHGRPAGFREPARPHADPWGVVTVIMHDLAAHGIKNTYGPEANLGAAVQHAAALLEALGVEPRISDEGDE
jgi:hypothetical protein